MKVKFQRLHPLAKIPTKATKGSAGYDLYAVHGATLRRGLGTVVSCGFALKIPDGWVGRVCPRSGLGKQGVLAMSGVIDSDYRGEVGVVLHYVAAPTWSIWVEEEFPPTFEVIAGDRIAQLVITEAPAVDFVEVSTLPKTKRGVFGFGSTGT